MFLLLQISICEAKSFMEKRYLLKDFVKGIDSLTYNIHDRNVGNAYQSSFFYPKLSYSLFQYNEHLAMKSSRLNIKFVIKINRKHRSNNLAYSFLVLLWCTISNVPMQLRSDSE